MRLNMPMMQLGSATAATRLQMLNQICRADQLLASHAVQVSCVFQTQAASLIAC